MTYLLASCPNCSRPTLCCGKIQTIMPEIANKELLFCRSCKLIVPVDEFKKILSSA